MNFKDTLYLLNEHIPTLSLRTALILANALASDVPNLSTHEGRVEYARSIPEVVDALRDGIIPAIKALRTASQDHGPIMSLMEAKQAVEALRT